MVHGDDKGLRLPPKIAPIQIVIIPIFKSAENLKKIEKYLIPLIKQLNLKNIRFKFDDRLKVSPGYKFNEWEMKGVPIRVEVGPRDMENNTVLCVQRDSNEKQIYKLNSIVSKLSLLLNEIQKNMFNQANDFMKKNYHFVVTFDEFKSIIKNGGFIQCGWDGNPDTEASIKLETKATIRCIISECQDKSKQCIYSTKPAKYEVVYAKAY
jgi:prolyl-tRNA synthetase